LVSLSLLYYMYELVQTRFVFFFFFLGKPDLDPDHVKLISKGDCPFHLLFLRELRLFRCNRSL
jgi:hypothetical protein